MLLKKTVIELEGEAIDELLQGGVLTNMTPGSRVRALVSVMTSRCGRVMDAVDINTAMKSATSSAGYFLDLIGSGVGVDRRDASACAVTKEDQNLRFYVSSGVLSDYLPSRIIPVNTTITDTAGSIVYTVTQDTEFGDGATEVYVSAIANGTGSAYRVGRGVLTSSSITDANVLVTNERGITNGADIESDDNYRYRILNHRASSATGNETAIRLAALSTPGVADAITQRHFNGPGTVDMLIIPVGNRTSDATLRAVAARVSAVSSGGDVVNVRGPRYVNITIDVRIDFTRSVPESDKAGVRSQVRNSITDYLDDIPLGGVLIIQELRARVQEASPKILDHEILCLGINGRAQILKNYRLFEDELFLPNPDVDAPIKVI